MRKLLLTSLLIGSTLLASVAPALAQIVSATSVITTETNEAAQEAKHSQVEATGNFHQQKEKPEHPLDPLCFTYGGTYLGICGILPGVDCRIISGSVLGGWVKCKHYNFGSGYIGCYIKWPTCTFYRFY